MKRRRPRVDQVTAILIAFPVVGVMFAFALTRSETSFQTAHCTVDVTPAKISASGAKRPASRRLFCGDRIIALKDDAELPSTPESVLVHDGKVACWFELVGHPMSLLTPQVVQESIMCTPEHDRDTG